ncbi:hypothetical protein RFI_20641 [Reticulomyxa filosa]|uniref:Kelch motif family protein n=1 Tax=Reticulomyxa filosa TaxID=46433 RepID=X6MTB1_RETFI|nr:hypothetical protein RFI_20641 [Reticulomyxa filosa]|eukprot:ETO16697.1 hypothetical protein RFI_20641 [Reticulomyxa filosa]
MGNQNKSQTSIISAPFQNLKDLPIPLSDSQCVLHKHELLICGGFKQKACYTYHTLKNEYKFICEYPSDVEINGHCVVKLVDNNKDTNQVTLLSFGGKKKHTLTMKYVSVWDNDNDNEMNKLKKSNNYNEWTSFTDSHNHPIIIGRSCDDYHGLRAVTGGSHNNLLFITYFYKNISVFDLNRYIFIKHDILPTNYINYHCFVSKSENRQEIVKKNKRIYEMLLFCYNTGFSIKYDEYYNTFQFRQLYVCKDISPFNSYAYVCINDIILFFGGAGYSTVSKSIHKYSIQENKWMAFQNTLPNPLYNCVAILSADNTNIHIIGGQNDKNILSLT